MIIDYNIIWIIGGILLVGINILCVWDNMDSKGRLILYFFLTGWVGHCLFQLISKVV